MITGGVGSRRGPRWLFVCLVIGLAVLGRRAGAVVVYDGVIDYGSEWAGPDVLSFADPLDDVSSTLTSGYELIGTSFYLDLSANTLSIGIDTYGIAGDADGNGDPGLWGTPPEVGNLMDPTDYGRRVSGLIRVSESIGVLLDMDEDGSYDYVLGVDPTAGNHTYTPDLGLYVWDGGTSYSIWTSGNWGSEITTASLTASPSPSSTAPDIELGLAGWSTLLGDPTPWEFDFRVVNGASGDSLGEDYLDGQVVPEPGGVLLLGLAAVGFVSQRWPRRTRSQA